MKRRTVRNDPIHSSERVRGAVVVQNFAVDMDKAVPAAQATPPSSTTEPRK
jgi:hypothetical protein